MIIQVRLFAAARQLAGQETIPVEVESPATLQQLRTALERQCPPLAILLPHIRFAVNAQYADEQQLVTEADEVACIPPVSGG
jgi:molybdopterin synthase sulfur carrier subunit